MDETILVVDDEPDMRGLLREMLEAQGYRVVDVESAGQALELISANVERIDLVLLDILMPGMDGLELGSILELRYPDLPVIYVSGLLGDYEDAPDILKKPFTMQQLLDKTANALAGAL